MKRIKKKLVKEFEELDKFKGRVFQFQYGALYYIRLLWGGEKRGRIISLRQRHSGTASDYETLLKTPVRILKASIRFLKDYERYEEKKKLRINETEKRKISD